MNVKTLSLPLLLTGSALLLASCNDNPTPQPVNELTVSGQVRELDFNDGTGEFIYPAWTGGAGKVNVMVGSKANFAQGTLNADGTFSVVLPKPDAALLSSGGTAEVLPASCTGNLTATGAADAKAVGAEFSVQAGKSGGISPVRFALSGTDSGEIEVGGYVYYDKAAGLSGQMTCVEDGVAVAGNINVQFNPGWNKVSIRMTMTQTTANISITTGSVPSQWVYMNEAAGSTPLSLGKQGLSPLKALSLESLPLPFLR